MRRRRGLILVGAGGLGRETVELVHAINAVRHTWDLLGFLDDSPLLQGTRIGGLPVLGPVESIRRWPGISVAVCAASPSSVGSRRQIVERLDLPDEAFATLIHPTVSLPRSAEVDRGSILLANVVMTADVRVGAHVVMMPHSVMTHDDVVNDFAILGARVALAGSVEIGGEAYVGAGALVREHGTIGARAVVGMGSVVVGSVPDDETWAGVPARPLRRPLATGGPLPQRASEIDVR